MTRRYSTADWRDIFYNAVREAPGGVTAAAAFLTDRREKAIHPEDLRRRLRGADGESLSTEMLELLSEWLIDMGRPDARRWLQSFNARFSMAAAYLPPPPEGGWACEASAIRQKVMQITAKNGLLAEICSRVTEDNQIDSRECDELEAGCMEIIELVFRLRRNARRAAGRSEDFT
ncbi:MULTISPECIES: hypothetical protein [unclassified Delftia]|uniref:hypothetical protein n=1 Tax=unclassified Delftia TaxID=2613839 RepID=UPI0019020C8A|nr:MULTISPECIES: hypothetical protein [unclassified Delftia]MBK0115412.1 hypothetical protein [Delftia sp. S65]MBK0120034.1 hypothetical protein [Delftia sp. S67]MBK0133215.1 hypothetical protein [Delftia sp. S66]